MGYLHGRKFGADLCDILGLDKNAIRKVTIEANSDSPAYVVIERLVTETEVTAFGDLLRRWVPVEATEWEEKRFLLENLDV